ncbi:MAG: hypothetical protein ACK56F_18790, partial [bacterium]
LLGCLCRPFAQLYDLRRDLFLTGDDLTGDYSAIYPSSFIGSFTKGSKRGFILNDCEVLGLSSFLRKVEPESKEFALIIDLSLPL